MADIFSEEDMTELELQDNKERKTSDKRKADRKKNGEALRSRTGKTSGLFERLDRKRIKREVERTAKASRRDADPEKEGAKDSVTFETPEKEDKAFRVIKGGAKPRNRQKEAIIVCTAVAALLVVFAVANLFSPAGIIEGTRVFLAGYGHRGSFPAEVSNTPVSMVERCGNDVIMLTDTSVYCYKSNGRLVYTLQHSYQKPAMSVSESRAIVFDRESENFMVINRTGILFEEKAEGTIISAGVSDCGAFAVSSYSADYVSNAMVYAADGKSKYVWNSSDSYITSVALSSNGKRLAVGCIKSVDGEYRSAVRMFSIKKTTPLSEFSCAGAVVLSVSFTDSGKIGAVFDDRYITLDDNSTTTETGFGEAALMSFDNTCSSHTAILLCYYNDSKNNLVMLIDSNGNQLFSNKFTDDAISVSVSPRYIFVLGKGEVSRFTKSGTDAGKSAVNVDCTDIVPSGSRAIVLGSSTIDKVSF